MNWKYYEEEFNKGKCFWKDSCQKLNDCVSGCRMYYTMHYLVGNSLLPEQYKVPKEFVMEKNSVDYNAYMRLEEIKKSMISFVKSGKNLVITGKNCGCGKTHYSTRMLLRYFYEMTPYAQGKPRGLFIDIPRLFTEQKISYQGKSDYLEFIFANIDTDLVIWDDLCALEMSSSEYNLLYSLINQRILAGKANIFTTNYSDKELYSKLGDKLFSRIFSSAEIIEFKEEDFRI